MDEALEGVEDEELEYLDEELDFDEDEDENDFEDDELGEDE